MYIHSLGIVHRDLKPENIMIEYENNQFDQIKIIDFGFTNYLEILQEKPLTCNKYYNKIQKFWQELQTTQHLKYQKDK